VNPAQFSLRPTGSGGSFTRRSPGRSAAGSSSLHGAMYRRARLRILGQDGELRHVHVPRRRLLSATGSVSGLVGTIQDATERTARSSKSIASALTFRCGDGAPEPLSLPRKAGRDARKPSAAVRRSRSCSSTSTSSSRINDTLGHAVGDTCACHRASGSRAAASGRHRRADACEGMEPQVCRHGGEEFIVLLNVWTTEEDAARPATRCWRYLRSR